MGRMAFMWKLSFGLREASYWSKIGLRSNLVAPKFQNFPGGACPQALLGYRVLDVYLMATALSINERKVYCTAPVKWWYRSKVRSSNCGLQNSSWILPNLITLLQYFSPGRMSTVYLPANAAIWWCSTSLEVLVCYRFVLWFIHNQYVRSGF